MPYRLLKKVLDQTEHVNEETIEKVIWLAIEIAREGREGRKVGTLFVIAVAQQAVESSAHEESARGRPDSARRREASP
jgi:DNA integrity scanning protein DisA with diadenylate cyclase activity